MPFVSFFNGSQPASSFWVCTFVKPLLDLEIEGLVQKGNLVLILFPARAPMLCCYLDLIGQSHLNLTWLMQTCVGPCTFDSACSNLAWPTIAGLGTGWRTGLHFAHGSRHHQDGRGCGHGAASVLHRPSGV